MIKHICDGCQKELDNKFYCEIMIREIKISLGLVKNEQGMQPQLFEKRLHLCQKCVEEKLKGL